MGRNSKRTLLGTIVLVVLFALTAYSADITFRFHIADEGVGYNSAAAHKDAYQYVVNIIVDDTSRDSVLYQKKSVNMLVIDSAGTQVTNNVELSSHDQLPQFPSSATLNYIFKGNYYAWKSMNVMLRANVTGTNAGFTVTGRWNPNAGTAYSGQ